MKHFLFVKAINIQISVKEIRNNVLLHEYISGFILHVQTNVKDMIDPNVEAVAPKYLTSASSESHIRTSLSKPAVTD